MNEKQPQSPTIRNSAIEFPVCVWRTEEGSIGVRRAPGFSYPEILDNCLSESDFDKVPKVIAQQVADKKKRKGGRYE